MEKFNAKFHRKSPSDFAQKIGIPLGWFVVHYNFVPKKKHRRLAHGNWYELKSEHGKIYRILRFSPSMIYNKKPEMVLDWVGWLDLYGRAENVDDPLQLSVQRIRVWNIPRAYISHPDPGIRLSAWLGLLSLALGILSVYVAVDWSETIASVAEALSRGMALFYEQQGAKSLFRAVVSQLEI